VLSTRQARGACPNPRHVLLSKKRNQVTAQRLKLLKHVKSFAGERKGKPPVERPHHAKLHRLHRKHKHLALPGQPEPLVPLKAKQLKVQLKQLLVLYLKE
jgi:hypothetical protein